MTPSIDTKKVHSVKPKTEFPYLIIIFISIFLIGLATNRVSLNNWPIFIIFLVAIAAYSAFMYRLAYIEIDTNKNEVLLLKQNLFGLRKVARYPLKEMQYTYKIERPGLYARVRNICRLYLNKKAIAAIIPDYDGWTDDSVHELVRGLVSSGVTKKFTGFSSKDAEISGL